MRATAIASAAPFVGMDSSEEKQIIAALRIERKIIDRNAVMNRRSVAQIGMTIGIADGDVVDHVLVFRIHRQDAI